jgi:hypothetical protein
VRRGRLIVAIALACVPAVALACGQTIDLQNRPGADSGADATAPPESGTPDSLAPIPDSSGDAGLLFGTLPAGATFATNQGPVQAIAASGTWVVWATPFGMFECAAPVATCAPKPLNSAPAVKSIAIIDDWMFWTDSTPNGFRWASITDPQTIHEVTAPQIAGGQIVTDGSSLYAIKPNSNYLVTCNKAQVIADAGTSECTVEPLTVGTLALTAVGGRSIIAFADGSIVRHDGPTADILKDPTSDSTIASSITVSADGSFLYWGDLDKSAIEYISLGTSALKGTIVTDSAPRLVASTSANGVFWATKDTLGYARRDPASAATETNLSVTALATHGDVVWYADENSGTILRRIALP